MKRFLLVLSFLLFNFSLSKANEDLLSLASNGALNSNTLKALSKEEMAEVKGGYYWITGLVDTSGLRHDHLGNVYGTLVARGEIRPDPSDRVTNAYFEVSYKYEWDNPRFSNYSKQQYTFTAKSIDTGEIMYWLNPRTRVIQKAYELTDEQIYRHIDPKVVYASKAVIEANRAFDRYRQNVIYRNRF